MPKIAIDPITRIEGHLRLEVQIDGGKVTDAWSTGTMFRGIELILKGRDPRDAWAFTQRICGVCTTVHAATSVRAVEDALGITIPLNAQIIRNLIEGTQYIQDHVIHFYHLHALDWVDITAVLKADPAATAKLAQSISDWHNSSETYFKSVQDRIKAFVDSGQLGLFANGYWGHPAYKLPPEANLMAVAHYLEALDWQREIIRLHSLLGAKNPNLQTYLVGGMAVPIDPNSQNAINADKLAQMKKWLAQAREFVEKVYIPDLLAVAPFYKDWAGYGAGLGNFLAYGEFPASPDNTGLFLPRGVILNKDLTKVLPMDHQKVAEYVSHSWYDYGGGDSASLHPWSGETKPHYTGPQAPFDSAMVSDGAKYSWLKSPRYDSNAMEVGPLARMLVAYASGVKPVQDAVNLVLKTLGVGPEALFSTLGRTAARGVETLVLAQTVESWVDNLAENIRRGDYKIHNGDKWDPSKWPAEAKGFGFLEAPRGALGHWVQIKDGAIANYQCVVPSTWNGSPRDVNGKRGAWEEALVGTPVSDPERPLEVLRTVHSFDPCMACSVHIIDTTGAEITSVKIV
ncbi:MAG: nickel-dependent hydrogenase large subunit [Anaerolineae bacterium]